MALTHSTVEPLPSAAVDPAAIPPLQNGDHLTRAEFHRRYEAMGDDVRAELIEGIVYLTSKHDRASSVSIDAHGTPHLQVVTWVGYYLSKTPGLIGGDNSTVFIDGINEPQPDVLLGIPATVGGQTRLTSRGKKKYVDGAPELIIEIAAGTVSIDLNAKLAAYQRNGVAEYLVVLAEDQREVRWFALRDDRFSPMRLDESGLLKSQVFPGLWLDPAALLAGDLSRLLAAIDSGCATEAHAQFVRRIVGRE